MRMLVLSASHTMGIHRAGINPPIASRWTPGHRMLPSAQPSRRAARQHPHAAILNSHAGEFFGHKNYGAECISYKTAM
jgi:hypothetical protein